MGTEAVLTEGERQLRLACFVLPVRDDRLLLARHTYAYPETWAMVGGMAESGEPAELAARREVLEETGLLVTTDALAGVVDRGDLLMLIFDGRVTGGVESVQADEVAELRWFAASELADDAVFDVVRQIGPRILDGVSGLAPSLVRWPEGHSHDGFLVGRA